MIRTAGIQPTHANKLARQLQHLNQAATTQDMKIPGWQCRAAA
jgi:plasmid maintenance system killer protein